jgi:hypothetical protein
VLHCDKASWFRHIEAPRVRFVLQALIVSDDDTLICRNLGKLDISLVQVCSLVQVFGASLWCKAHTSGCCKSPGIFGRMSVDRTKRALALGALLISALALAGCSTSIADLPLVGTPADAPARPKEAGSYLPVHDLPPDRDEAAMAPAERDKIQKELAAARDRQASTAAAQNPAAK